MKAETREAMLHIAEALDAFRVIPRLMMLGYGIMVFQISAWFMGLDDPSGAQSAFVSTVWGAAAVISGWYASTGRRWDK